MKIICNLIEAHIVRKNKGKIEFLLLKRSGNVRFPNLWQMVTGEKEKEEEDLKETVLREIYEETSLTPKKIWLVQKINYYKNKHELCIIPVFAALVSKNSQVKISNEHSDYAWVSRTEAKKLVAWDGQRNSIDIIYNFFVNKKDQEKFFQIDITPKI